jgi:hypothetical protein
MMVQNKLGYSQDILESAFTHLTSAAHKLDRLDKPDHPAPAL